VPPKQHDWHRLKLDARSQDVKLFPRKSMYLRVAVYGWPLVP